jgi:hypothetical protein
MGARGRRAIRYFLKLGRICINGGRARNWQHCGSKNIKQKNLVRSSCWKQSRCGVGSGKSFPRSSEMDLWDNGFSTEFFELFLHRMGGILPRISYSYSIVFVFFFVQVSWFLLLFELPCSLLGLSFLFSSSDATPWRYSDQDLAVLLIVSINWFSQFESKWCREGRFFLFLSRFLSLSLLLSHWVIVSLLLLSDRWYPLPIIFWFAANQPLLFLLSSFSRNQQNRIEKMRLVFVTPPAR